jgi:peptidoglycan/LPS O-acetylase OafA/YrhL
LHLWSLGIEEQFYIVWPALLVLGWQLAIRLRYVILFIAVVSFATNVLLVTNHPISSFYLPLARFWELLIGGWLAYGAISLREPATVSQILSKSPAYGRVPLSISDVKSIAGLTLLAFAIAGLNNTLPFPGWWALPPTLGTYLLISAGEKGWINRNVLSNRVLVFIGLISFPLYLWHWPLLSFSRIIENRIPSVGTKFAALSLSFLLAYLVFRFVERPARSGKHRQSLAIALSLFMATIGIAGLLVRFEIIQPRSASDIKAREWSVYIKDRDWTSFLPQLKTLSFEDLDILIGGTTPPKVLFFGDSHVAHIIPRLTKLLAERPAETKALAVMWGGGCVPNLM